MKYYAIILGGGSGKRMQLDIPKQFLLLDGLPIIMHSINAFATSKNEPELLIVLHPKFHSMWKELCQTHQFETPHLLVAGGEERFHSVKNGLNAIQHEGLVAIHDGVRPLVDTSLIETAYEVAKKNGNAIPAIKMTDSVRKVINGNSEIVNRDELVMIQTPQTFKTDQIKAAFSQEYSKEFTDDASVAEAHGHQIHLIEGQRSNIKITYPEDLAWANIYLNSRKSL